MFCGRLVEALNGEDLNLVVPSYEGELTFTGTYGSAIIQNTDWVEILFSDILKVLEEYPIYGKNGVQRPIIVFSSEKNKRAYLRHHFFKLKSSTCSTKFIILATKIGDCRGHDPCLVVFYDTKPVFPTLYPAVSIKIANKT